MNYDGGGINYLYKADMDIDAMARKKALPPFSDAVVRFLGGLSETVLENPECRRYNDIASFAFFIRKQNLNKMRDELLDGRTRVGRGLAYHIAPSNVPVNFAYSLAAGLLGGNANIVKVSSKNFPQVRLLCGLIAGLLSDGKHDDIKEYIAVIQYNNERAINDYLSSICQTRLIWGGDGTIAEIRKSKLPPRGVDITFADRYSVCVIDVCAYINSNEKDKIAAAFYNDTYGFDQDACFSPRLVYWVDGAGQAEKAKRDFWARLNVYAEQRYNLEDAAASEKYISACRMAVNNDNVHIIEKYGNLIVRCEVNELNEDIVDYSCGGGFFIEYTAPDLDGLANICSKKLQTISSYGYDKMELVNYIINSGCPGADRITEIGKAHEFSLIWDGVNLITALSRIIM